MSTGDLVFLALFAGSSGGSTVVAAAMLAQSARNRELDDAMTGRQCRCNI